MNTQQKKCRVHTVNIQDADLDEDSGASYDLDMFIEVYQPKEHNLKEILREGDIIDTKGYRGLGLWFFDGVNLIKSSGEYGYFLPDEAWSQVEQHGLQYFERTGAECVLIPDKKEISIFAKGKKVGSMIVASGHALCINGGSDGEEYVIDGKKYSDTSLCEIY